MINILFEKLSLGLDFHDSTITVLVLKVFIFRCFSNKPYIFTQPIFQQAGCDTRSVFKLSTTALN